MYIFKSACMYTTRRCTPGVPTVYPYPQYPWLTQPAGRRVRVLTGMGTGQPGIARGLPVLIPNYVYNASKGLAPAWVSSKIPNPTRDNGLLIVVKGDHCGKYVRRIHHRHHEDNGDRQTFILLAVVKKVEGAADTLTGEQFELGPDSLCLACETNEDKKLNTNLMNSLRENARKRK